jgi:hypothetical protein
MYQKRDDPFTEGVDRAREDRRERVPPADGDAIPI